jgi:predicted permease
MIFFNVLEIVAPVFFLSLIGFVWVKTGLDYNIQFVTRLSMTLAVPCLIFVSLMKTNIKLDNLINISLATIVVYGLITVLTFIYVKFFSLNNRTFLAPLIFGNTGNIGLPLSYFAFGAEGLDYAVVIFALMGVYAFTFGVWIVSGGGALGKTIKEPMVGATILGAIFLWQGWETPQFITSTLELVGQMAIPLMLITLGVTIARLKPNNLFNAAGYAFIKLIICTLCSIFGAYWFSLSHIPMSILILQVTTPVAVTSYLIATKYEADSESVASLVIVSTVLSIGYIPLLLLFLI